MVNGRTPWLVSVCVYLCVVPDIEAQTDKAGFELLSAQCARVVLGVRAVGRVRGQQRGHAAHTWEGWGNVMQTCGGREEGPCRREKREDKRREKCTNVRTNCAVLCCESGGSDCEDRSDMCFLKSGPAVLG